MAITSLGLVLLLFSLMVLCKKLAPRHIQREVSDLVPRASANISATLDLKPSTPGITNNNVHINNVECTYKKRRTYVYPSYICFHEEHRSFNLSP